MKSVTRTCRNCLFALVLGCLPATSTLAVPIFSVSSPNPFLGEIIHVNVNASGLVDLYDYQFDLNFDPTRLQFVGGAFEGPFLATAGATFFFGGIPALGSVQFVFDTLLGPGPGASGNGLLASLDFRALAKGPTTLSLANVLAQDTPGNLINVALVSAQITVPEPGTLALLALALAGCVVAARRKGSMHHRAGIFPARTLRAWVSARSSPERGSRSQVRPAELASLNRRGAARRSCRAPTGPTVAARCVPRTQGRRLSNHAGSDDYD